jgi:hypothetical protein
MKSNPIFINKRNDFYQRNQKVIVYFIFLKACKKQSLLIKPNLQKITICHDV